MARPSVRALAALVPDIASRCRLAEPTLRGVVDLVHPPVPALMPYRESTYIERSGPRCFCDQRTSIHCACCGRPRCPLHLTRDLCNRCDQAAARVRPRLSTYAWTSGGISGTGITLACLVGGIAAGPLVGLLAGAAIGGLSYRLLLRRWKRRAGPALAASVGELAAEPREPDTFDASLGGPNNRIPPGAGRL